MEVAEFTARKKTSNNDYCSVRDCDSRANINLSLSFHRLPKPNERYVNKQNIFGNNEKIDLFKAWTIALKITNFTKRTQVCSLHFQKSDYLFAGTQASKRYLKKNAVPSCNLPVDERIKMNAKVNKARWQRRLRRSDTNENLNTIKVNKSAKESVKQPVKQVIEENHHHKNHAEINVGIEKAEEQVICEDCEMQANVNTEENQNNNPQMNATQKLLKDMLVKAKSPEPLTKHQEVQVNTDCFVPSVIRCINSDQKLSTMTGLESMKLLDTIVEIVRKVTNDKYEHYNIKMNTRERVILTYMKLKQNASYSFLAALFNCYSAKHCQRVFYETIKILSKCLKAAIPWPSKEEISKNLPKCFEGFENTRVVVDCTEIYTQTPANLCCQLLSYSNYKKANTCKVMTGVSPAGNITFVSKMYGGRASDSAIFQQSSLIQLLQPGDGVMVDRGFLIDEVCEVNQWKCIRPPFMKDQKQLTKEEALLTAKIAKARVHVERSNQRIKTFELVGKIMPATLVPIVDDIFTVICGTVNMSAPIISDSKFMDAQ